MQVAAQLGIDGVVCGQHFLGTEMRYYQPIPYLAHLAPHAPAMRIVLGIVLVPLLNPVQVAEDVATLDVVTGGRVTLGAGMGYSDRELRAFGIDRADRAARFEESLTLIPKLWSGRTAGRPPGSLLPGRPGHPAVCATRPAAAAAHLDRRAVPRCGTPGGPACRRVVCAAVHDRRRATDSRGRLRRGTGAARSAAGRRVPGPPRTARRRLEGAGTARDGRP